MTFPHTLLLITTSVLIVFAVRLVESRESSINCKRFIEKKSQASTSSGIRVEVPDTFAPLETIEVNIKKSKLEAAISEIHRDASLSAEYGASSIAVDFIEQGLKNAIELVAASSYIADRALGSSIEKSCDDPEAAIKEVQKGIKTAQQIIYAAGFSVNYSFETVPSSAAVGEKTSDGSISGLKIFQYGATYAIASLSAAEALSTNGLKSNLAAAIKGLDAAQEAAITGYEAAIASLVLAGKSALKGLSYDVIGINKKDNQICKTLTKTQSAEAKAAINAVKYSAEQAIKSISQGTVSNAIYKIEQGLTCGIQATAAGEASVLRAISIATKLALNEPEIAMATFDAGVKALMVAIITAGNETCQGLDSAASILGNQKINKILTAILKVQNGITSALADIETADKLGSIGLKIGGDVAEQGLKSVYKSVLAVLFVFYSLLVTIGEGAF